MSMDVYYRADIGQIEVRGATSKVLKLTIIVDDEIYAIYSNDTIETPLIGRKRPNTTDAFAPLPVSVMQNKTRIECLVTTEQGEATVPVLASIVAPPMPEAYSSPVLSPAAEAGGEKVKANWGDMLRKKLVTISFDPSQTAESLGLATRVDWASYAQILPRQKFLEIIFMLVLLRRPGTSTLAFYEKLMREGISPLDIVRRIVNSNEAKRQDLSFLSDTEAMNGLMRDFVQAEMENAETAR